MKKVFLLFSICFLVLNLNASFNIVDRLASPFAYDDDSSSYSYSYNDYKPPKKGFSKSDLPFFIIILIILLFTPSSRYGRYRTYDYNYPNRSRGYSSIAYIVAGLFMHFIQKKTEASYKSFTEEDLIKREREAEEILKKLNLNPDDFKKLSAYALEQYMLMISGQKNDMAQISSDYLYKKYLKEIAELYQKEIKTEIENFSVDDVKIINVRYTDYEKAISAFVKYTSRQYYVDAVNKNFVSGERFPITKYLFLTFVYDGIWKLSLIEQKGESYVMKLENLLGTPSFVNNMGNKVELSDGERQPYKEISKPKMQLLIAETFFNIYSWWKNDTQEISVKIEEEIKQKLIKAREKIKNEKNIFLKIDKFQIISIDFLSYEKNPAGITKGVTVRINFSLNGKFSKNSFTLVDGEQKLDEIWLFEIDREELILKDIIKRFITSSKDIESSPLQIEWYI
ncbi:MAG TPA: hypothetical protein PK103_01890 [Elusimicrobiales bacterium]|nr:hypothetical protein [Elusimicrobiales bacterium]HOL62098.1 hypothetical protein [Elusimicrobiales bacterium]HPO94426.1 hypothetical protein [Elusimicrobiales bacterium]